MATIEEQRAKIMAALRSGSWWTTAALRAEIGSDGVAARIHELGAEFRIDEKRVPCVGGTEIMYRLAPGWAQPDENAGNCGAAVPASHQSGGTDSRESPPDGADLYGGTP